MITALRLIFSPFEAWTRITAAQRSVPFILGSFLLPLLVVCVGIESYSLLHWGERRGEFGMLIKVPKPLVLEYALAQVLLLLACVLLSAFSLQAITNSFNVAATYRQAFTAVAYGMSPIILARLLDAFPPFPTWVCWAIGALLSVSVLYHGVALALRPEQTKGFGLYLVAILIVILSSGVAHFIALTVLRGKAFL